MSKIIDSLITDSLELPELIPDELPVLPMRDTVIFPFTTYPVLVGRDVSQAAVNTALEGSRYILLLAQKNPEEEKPAANDLYRVGTLAYVNQVTSLPGNLFKVLVNGVSSVDVINFKNKKGNLSATFEINEKPKKGLRSSKLKGVIKRSFDTFERYIMANQDLPEEIIAGFDREDDPEKVLYIMASHLDLSLEEKQSLLEKKTLELQYKRFLHLITRELEVLVVSNDINEKVQNEIQETQKKFFIQEQIKALQDELGEGEYGDPELNKIKETAVAAEMPEYALKRVEEELEKLRKIPQMSPEYGVARNYLDWMVSLPWSKMSEDNLDISRVQEILDKDHFGLEKPKERIVEHIAVLNLVKHLKGQILCFVGPPGVGKTSIAKSIANALNREMIRISLGGISDEAEIRGHRKTYIGSMPGRIIQGMRKAGNINPVIILDEIDKIGNDFRGDPSSAVLEVLDPEQNNSFNDHYLDIDYDLSKVLFIATANVASRIQDALLDRMEIINLPGYLEHDKYEIAKKHLIPKLMKSHGLESGQLKINKAAILSVVRNYTSEAGVRELEQKLAAICRKVARKVVEGDKTKTHSITAKEIPSLLGVGKYRDRDLEKENKVGSVNGLAWTYTGGAILQIDVAAMKGKSNFRLTGKLGDVMKESAQAALTFIRSNADAFDIDPEYFEKHELHIHIPEGAISKDGPSAGMAMALAMLSLITHKKTKHNVAMTGEITLKGEVLAIGGLNEKLLAAQRNKIKKVLVPFDNAPDLTEIPEKIKQGLEIITVKSIHEAIPHVIIE